jgi:putative tryptophan/tyrosine transport system substrate-binding protein
MARRSRRRVLQGGLALAGLGLLSGCGTGAPRGQQASLHRIGYLAPDAAPTRSTVAFVQGLRDLGYAEGQNIEIVYRWAEGREERLSELAAELAALPVDVILASSAVAARAAKDATGTIPIVIGASNDPVAAGLVASLARPGGNVTGLSLVNPLLVAKRLELLKEMVPSSGRIAALVYPASATGEQDWKEAQTGARALGLDLARYEVRSGDDLAAAFAAMAAAGAEALLVLPNQFFTRNRERLLSLAAQHRLPAMYEHRQYAEAGGLMSYGADTSDLLRRSATYVDKILKGAKPADLPVEQPTTFDFAINIKTAQALGLTIPRSIRTQATEIIE